MPKVFSRPAVLLTTVLTAGALLVGCGQPSQAGAAAIVGNEAIPLADVQQQVSTILAQDDAARRVQQQHKFDVQARRILSFDIQHMLIAKLARQVGATVNNSTVDELVARSGGPDKAYRTIRDQLGVQVFTKASFLRYVRDYSLLMEIGRRLAPRVAGSYYQVVSDSRQQAESYAKQFAADPAHAARVIQQAKAASLPAAAQNLRLLQSINTAAAAPLFGIPAGTVAVYPFGGRSTRWNTVYALDRRTDIPPDPRAAATLSQQSEQVLVNTGQNLLVATAYRTNVRPSPRYGVWDPISLTVVPSAGEAAGSIVPVRSVSK